MSEGDGVGIDKEQVAREIKPQVFHVKGPTYKSSNYAGRSDPSDTIIACVGDIQVA